MVFSKEFDDEISSQWREFLARTGAKPVYWRHPDFEKWDYDNIGELCPVSAIICDGRLL